MKLCRKRKTDEEYIECIRKRLARSKRYGIFQFCCAFLFIGAFYWWWQLIFSYQEPLPGMEEETHTGLFIGIPAGAMGAVLIVLANQCAVWGLKYIHGQRTERLLVQLCDELKEYTESSP